MIPLCLIIGDSTALGTANALAAQGIRCAVHARVGAPSGDSVKTFRSPVGGDRLEDVRNRTLSSPTVPIGIVN